MNIWTNRDRVTAFTAVALAVVILLLTFGWSTRLVVAAGFLSVLLAGLALQEGLPAGSCPSCRARPRRQQRHEVAAALHAESDSWLVLLTVERLCSNCRETRTLVEEVSIPRVHAGSEAEALVLARSGRFAPMRIRTGN